MMHYSAPRTIEDIAIDGAINQADVEAAFSAQLGVITGVEYNRGATGWDVRFGRANSPDITFRAEEVATIQGDEWTWTSSRIAEAADTFGIPELRGTQPASETLIAATRTIYNNAPVYIVPVQGPNEGSDRVLALIDPMPSGPVNTALATAAAALGDEIDLGRALVGFATQRGLGIEREGNLVRFSDGSALIIRDGQIYDLLGGLELDDVRADAFYLADEHTLLFDAQFPQVQPTLNFQTGIIALHSPTHPPLVAECVVVAVVTGDEFRWSWADPLISNLACTREAFELRNFGFAQTIPAFTSPTLNVEKARAWELINACKPILHKWVHVMVPVAADKYVIALLDHNDLRLPPPTEAAVRATLKAPISRDLDRTRALTAYGRFRGLQAGEDHDGPFVLIDGQKVHA